MNLVLKLLSSSFLKSRLFKTGIQAILTLLTLYYLVNKYHFSPIEGLKNKIQHQAKLIKIKDLNISNLQVDIKLSNDELKNKLFECENNNNLENLHENIERIESEKTPKINTNIGTHTITI